MGQRNGILPDAFPAALLNLRNHKNELRITNSKYIKFSDILIGMTVHFLVVALG